MRNPELDRLRVWAIVLVLIRHLYPVTADILHQPWQRWTATNFETGVDLFFVISGYVVTDAHSRLMRAMPAGGRYVAFLQRRFLRLWPAAAFWLLFSLGAGLLMQPYGIWPPADRLWSGTGAGLLFMANFDQLWDPTVLGYFWSLSVEWQCYLLLPLVMAAERRLRIALLVAVLASCAVWRPGGHLWWLLRFDGIPLGMLIWHWSQRLPATSSAVPRPVAIAITLGLVSALVLVGHLIPHVPTATSAEVLIAGALVALAVRRRGFIADFGVPRAFDWLASRVYSLYLAHIPVLIVTGITVAHWWPGAPMTAVAAPAGLLALGAADLCWRHLESRFMHAAPVAARAQALRPTA